MNCVVYMVVPNQAIEMIKKYEASNQCYLQAYKCPAGQWAIGWGTSFYSDGSAVQDGDIITEEEADRQLYDYCNRKCSPIIEKLQKLCGFEFNDNQKTALFSLLYNIKNANKFCETKCAKAIIIQDYETAMQNWDWIKANGKILKGLVARRNEEIELFFGVKNYWK